MLFCPIASRRCLHSVGVIMPLLPTSKAIRGLDIPSIPAKGSPVVLCVACSSVGHYPPRQKLWLGALPCWRWPAETFMDGCDNNIKFAQLALYALWWALWCLMILESIDDNKGHPLISFVHRPMVSLEWYPDIHSSGAYSNFNCLTMALFNWYCYN